MLFRITNRCHANCPHCMIDASGPDGEHMTMDTFERALASSVQEIEDNLATMHCTLCGLSKNLDLRHREAIGER